MFASSLRGELPATKQQLHILTRSRLFERTISTFAVAAEGPEGPFQGQCLFSQPSSRTRRVIDVTPRLFVNSRKHKKQITIRFVVSSQEQDDNNSIQNNGT